MSASTVMNFLPAGSTSLPHPPDPFTVVPVSASPGARPLPTTRCGEPLQTVFSNSVCYGVAVRSGHYSDDSIVPLLATHWDSVPPNGFFLRPPDTVTPLVACAPCAFLNWALRAPGQQGGSDTQRPVPGCGHVLLPAGAPGECGVGSPRGTCR